MLGPAVAVEKIVDVGAGSLQRPVPLRNVGLELVYAIRSLSALVHLDPNTLLLGDYLALAVKRAAAGAVTKILGTRHGADVFHQSQDAVAAGLTPEHGFLEGELGALQCLSGAGTFIDPAQHRRQDASQRARRVGRLDDVGHAVPEGLLLRRALGRFEEIEPALGSPRLLLGYFFPLGRQRLRTLDDPLYALGIVVTADVRSRVALATPERDHARGSLHSRRHALVGGCGDLRLNSFHQ